MLPDASPSSVALHRPLALLPFATSLGLLDLVLLVALFSRGAGYEVA